MNQWLLHPVTKPLVFVLSLLPFAALFHGAVTDQLGANPAEHLIRSTGEWALRFLCLTLAVTPLRMQFGWAALARLRRMLGLYVFFYALLHFLCYAVFDMGLGLDEEAWGAILRDIPKRPFILVGFAALLLLLPLALTSFNRAIRALGAPRWRMLHRLVYAVACLAVLHFYWMRAGKQDFAEVAVYGAILALLLGWRIVRRWRGARTQVQAGKQGASGGA
ncbi:sulfite oxidase heme-binding subunit YedZ [Hylemonella sp. W303a]|uniref:sulfite oxidase heme-binding subunit YedZ n=1 Tax=Hylemonella sp. W303a TaxID=3389873 RepID=UPI00396B04EE